MPKLIAICPTCGARFRSKNERLLGHVVACPKCGGMMQIEAAAEESEDAVEVSASVETDEPESPDGAGYEQETSVVPPARSTRVRAAIGVAVVVLIAAAASVFWFGGGARDDEPVAARQPLDADEAEAVALSDADPLEVRSPSEPADDEEAAAPQGDGDDDGGEASETIEESRPVDETPPDEGGEESADAAPSESASETDGAFEVGEDAEEEETNEEVADEEASDPAPVLSEELPSSREATEEALALPIVGLATGEAEFADVLGDVAAISRVAVSADWPALALSGRSPSDPLDLTLESTTLHGVLAAIASQVDAELMLGDGWVDLQRPSGDALFQVRFSDAQAAGDWIEAIQSASDRLGVSLKVEPGGLAAKFTFSGPACSVWAASRLLDSIAAAGELTFAAEAPTRADWSLLRTAPRDATITLFQPTPMLEIVRQIERAGEVRLLVDWPSLAAADVAPARLATFSSQARPWSEALEMLLQALQAECVPLDARSLYISTQPSCGLQAELYAREQSDAVLQAARQLGVEAEAIPATDAWSVIVAPGIVHRAAAVQLKPAEAGA